MNYFLHRTHISVINNLSAVLINKPDGSFDTNENIFGDPGFEPRKFGMRSKEFLTPTPTRQNKILTTAKKSVVTQRAKLL